MTFAPFRFEDLNGEPEPDCWGPKYTRPVKAKRPVNDETNIPTNAPSGQKGPVVDDKKFRAKLLAEFQAAVAADRKRRTDKQIVVAYWAAMGAKRLAA